MVENMRTTKEISKDIRLKIMQAITATEDLQGYKVEYIDCNITAEPGDPELFEEQGCNGLEMLLLLDEFDRLSSDGMD